MKQRKLDKYDKIRLKIYEEAGTLPPERKLAASEAWVELAIDNILRLFLKKLAADTKKQYSFQYRFGYWEIFEKYKDCLGEDDWYSLYRIECFDDVIDAVRYCYLTDKQKKEWKIIKSANELMEGKNDKKTKS